MNRLFGTDGVRGVAITELTCELAMNIGRAAALVLGSKEAEKPHILVGKDTRVSSDTLECALVAGLTSAGANAELLGVVPTPALAFLVREFNAYAGVMISASHNSFEDNGIKIFSEKGEKLSDEIIAKIEKYILDEPEKIALKSGANIGEICSLYSGKDAYMSLIENSIEGDLSGLKLLIDCANGSAVSCAGIFLEMGAECDFIGNAPNGININKNCGSTHLGAISAAVKTGNYHAGIAFDGDADRCLFVDEKGGEISGDKIIALLAKSMKEKGKLKNNTVVVTVMSNLGFHEYMHEHGVKTISAAVGDRYVYEEMKKNNCNLGGENSGHIILADIASTGDGILTATQFLNLLKEAKKPLSELVSEIKNYPQRLIGIKIKPEEKANWNSNENIKKVIKEAENFLGENGRVNVRASGTEPLLRIMVEGKNEDEVDTWAEKIKEVVERELCV
jgi:phosphoglucosamine mutase